MIFEPVGNDPFQRATVAGPCQWSLSRRHPSQRPIPNAITLCLTLDYDLSMAVGLPEKVDEVFHPSRTGDELFPKRYCLLDASKTYSTGLPMTHLNNESQPA